MCLPTVLDTVFFFLDCNLLFSMLLCYHVLAHHRRSSYTWFHMLSLFAALKMIVSCTITSRSLVHAYSDVMLCIGSGDFVTCVLPRRESICRDDSASLIHYAMSHGKGKAKASAYQQSCAPLMIFRHVLTILLHREFGLDFRAPRYRGPTGIYEALT